MPPKPTSTGGKHIPTETPGIYRRDARFLVRWTEDGRRQLRSFPSYSSAVAFKRDYIVPHREKRGLPPTAIIPKKRGTGWVYVFQSTGQGEPLKIGWSVDPARRLGELKTAQVHSLDLVMLVPGTMKTEALMHAHVAEYRLSGEWYSREALMSLTALLWSSLAP